MSAIFGEFLNFKQSNGLEIKLRVYGDEHYARYENADGYTAIYDEETATFYYAALKGNQLFATGVPIENDPPSGIARHLQDSAAVRRAKKEERELRRPPEAQAFQKIIRTLGPNQGLLEGRRLSLGTVRGLTVLVNFSDTTTSISVPEVEEMLNGTNYRSNGNICSVREYFLKVSSNKLDYTNTVVGPFTLSKPRQYYISNLLVEETMQLVAASGLDLTQFDSRNEGIIDALNILYAGQSQYQGELWPHNHYIDIKIGSVRTNLYLLTGLGRNPSELTIGTFCHENGHLLCRFPDMYDYGNRDNDFQNSAGIGYYCLMGAGNHLDSGKSPAPVSAYLRDLAGWCDNVVTLNTPGAIEIRHGDYNTIYKYNTSKPNEYFLVESRLKKGLDRAGLSSGMAIYHCDINGSNEWQEGSTSRHYQCALLQADGKQELESNTNQGDGADLFRTSLGAVLSSTSKPNTRQWDGRDSGLTLSDIVIGRESIRFTTGAVARTARLNKEMTEVTTAISKTGNDYALVFETSGIAQRILVNLQVQSCTEEDIMVELFAPSGRRSLLYTSVKPLAEAQEIVFDSRKPGELQNLIGQPMKGAWVISLYDNKNQELNILKEWSLELDQEPAGKFIKSMAQRVEESGTAL